MENASKALLIAGAILIAIVLISLGVMILGQGSESIKNNDMSEAEIAAYNSPFEAYTGDNVRGNTVRLLIDKLNQHNRQYRTSDPSKLIALAGTSTSTNGDGKNDFDKTAFGTAYSYGVTATYDTNGGLITTMTVTKK